MQQNDRKKQTIIMSQNGDIKAFEGLVRASCGSVYPYAAVTRKSKSARMKLMKETYMSAWRSIKGLDDPDAFDIWIKKIMWKLVKSCDNEQEYIGPIYLGDDDRMVKEAFAAAGELWQISEEEKKKLTGSIMRNIKKGMSE